MTQDDQAAAAVGRIPSGVAILTAAAGDRSTGMLASWFQQASFEPLLVTVAVKRGRPIRELMESSGRFALNLLAENPKEMFRVYARGFGPDEDAFADVACRRSAHGVRLDEALAYLGCRIVQRVATGDHDLYVGQVEEARQYGDGRPHVHLRKTGANY